MAAPKAPVIGGSKASDVTLEESVFAVELTPHLVHETVRAELNAARAGTRGSKSRGLVAGGRSKPWRQKGTGRARAGTTRAPHWTGGGVAFAPGMRSFEVKVNRKVRRTAFRSALSDHAANGTLAILDGSGFDAPSTKQAAVLLSDFSERPTLVVLTDEEEILAKSFRNLEGVLVTAPGELEVAALVWARSVVVSKPALPLVLGRAGVAPEEGLVSLHPNQVLLAPVVSEKSYSLITDRKYTFKVHEDAHKTQIRQAVEELFDVKVESVNVLKVQSKPKRRGLTKGRRPGWKKAIVELREGYEIEIFEGAAV